MTFSEIQTALIEVADKLETINADPTFREFQDSDNFTTSNDLVLTDAIQAIYEVEGALS